VGFRLEPGNAYRRAEGAAQPLVPTPEDLFDLGHALEVEVAVGAEEVGGAAAVVLCESAIFHTPRPRSARIQRRTEDKGQRTENL
jgi:hypothetical protein